MVKSRESVIFVDVFCLEHDLDALWSLLGSGFWTLWKRVAGSQWHWGLWCVAWRLFFGSIDHFCFCWLSRFLRKICSMIPLIVFVFVDFRIFNGRFVAWLHWSFLFSVIFAFFTRDLYHDSFDHFCFRWSLHCQRERCRRCGKTAMIPLIIFFAVNLAALDGAIPKLHVKNLPEKKTAGEKAPSQYCRLKICRWEGVICRWEGAIPILPAVARPHPKIADEACNLDWGPLECQCVASSGTVFGALWFCPEPEHFYSRNPSSKTSLARQGCSISMWTCSEFLSLRTRFYRRAGL